MATPVKFVQTAASQLYVSLSAAGTSMTIVPYPTDLDGVKLTMSDFGTLPTLTVDPKVAGVEEIISFTGIIDNGNNTATLTGLTRNLEGKSPYTASLLAARAHGSSATVVFSDNPQVYASFPAKNNDETILGNWTFVNSPISLSATPASTTAIGNTRLTSTPATVIGNPTITIASPAVFTLSNHGLTLNDTITLTTTGALPTGLAVGTTYFVIAGGFTANTFEVSLLPLGTAVTTTGSQSGTHTVTRTTPYAIGNEDTRLPTASIAAALNAASSPSASNPFITQQGLGGFGDGRHGAVVLDGTTTYNTFSSLSGSTYTLSKNLYATSLTINSGITLVANGYLVYANGIGAGSGTITWGTPNPGTTGSAGAQSGSGTLKNVAGAAPGTGGSGSGGPNNGTSGTAATAQVAVLGTTGQAGGGATNAAGTNGGAITAPFTDIGVYRFLTVVASDRSSTGSLPVYVPQGQSAGGSGGVGGSGVGGGAGGGAGATGGIVVVFVNIYQGTWTLIATGAAGGAGGAAGGGSSTAGGGGGGGNGGWIFFVYGLKTGTVTYTVTGGAAGAAGTGSGGAAGGAGAAGGHYEIQASNLI